MARSIQDGLCHRDHSCHIKTVSFRPESQAYGDRYLSQCPWVVSSPAWPHSPGGRVDEEPGAIKLTGDQAFVLSDWLYEGMHKSGALNTIVEDRAVWSVTYAISGTLDKALSERSRRRRREEVPTPSVAEDWHSPPGVPCCAPDRHQDCQSRAVSTGDAAALHSTAIARLPVTAGQLTDVCAPLSSR